LCSVETQSDDCVVASSVEHLESVDLRDLKSFETLSSVDGNYGNSRLATTRNSMSCSKQTGDQFPSGIFAKAICYSDGSNSCAQIYHTCAPDQCLQVLLSYALDCGGTFMVPFFDSRDKNEQSLLSCIAQLVAFPSSSVEAHKAKRTLLTNLEILKQYGVGASNAFTFDETVLKCFDKMHVRQWIGQCELGHTSGSKIIDTGIPTLHSDHVVRSKYELAVLGK
jgi:hypothetical protein